MIKMNFLKKRIKILLRKLVRFGGISLQPPWLATRKLNGFLSLIVFNVFCLFFFCILWGFFVLFALITVFLS